MIPCNPIFHIAGSDYIAVNDTLTFDSENTIRLAFVGIINDDEQEGTETFTVQLTLLDGTLCDTATVSITDDEAPPTTTTTPGMLMVNISPFLHDVLSQLSVLFAYSPQSDDTVAAEQVHIK